jgi:hypothetical protein
VGIAVVLLVLVSASAATGASQDVGRVVRSGSACTGPGPECLIPSRDRSRYLNIVAGDSRPALAYVLGGTLRLAPGNRSYRLVGFDSGDACDSLLRSPGGRYVLYGTSRGSWPALEVLDLSTGARFTFRAHACDPAWGSDGQIAYIHYLSNPDSISFSARVLVQRWLGGEPRAWTGDGPWADPIWAGRDLLVNSGPVLTSPKPGPLVILYGPGRSRIVESRPHDGGPYITVVAVNPSGSEALLDTQRVSSAGFDGDEDLASLLRVRDDTVLSSVRVQRPAYAGLAANGDWAGSTIITTDGVFDGGSSHPPPTLVTLTVTANRLRLRPAKPFIDAGYELLGQDLAEPYEPTFLDPNGRHIAVWFEAIGRLQYLDCDTLTGRCTASRNYTISAPPAVAADTRFLSNPSRP